MSGDHFEVIFAHAQTDKSSRMIKISPKQPLGKKQKESSEELSQIKTTSGQNRIHPITILPLKMIPFQPMIGFQMAEDRLNG